MNSWAASIFVRAQAIMARMEAMKIENTTNRGLIYEPPHKADAFYECEQELNQLAIELGNQ